MSGFVSNWLILFPEPALAPVIPPVTEPTVQLKVLDVLANREISVLEPLQTLAVEEFVTMGFGSTVTTME